MRAVVVLVLVLCAVSVQSRSLMDRLKARTALQARTKSMVDFSVNLAGGGDSAPANCDHASVGSANCAKLTAAATAGTTKVNAMITHIDANHKDAKFKAAFGDAAVEATVRANLVLMRDGTFKLWNAWANKDATVYSGAGAAFAGLGVVTDTTKLIVGPSAYVNNEATLALMLIHEASHAFAKTIDIHPPNNLSGYKDSGHFEQVKGANNADSYRVYAESV